MVGHATDCAGDVEWVEDLVQGEARFGVRREDLAIAGKCFEESSLCTCVGDEVEVVKAFSCSCEVMGFGGRPFRGWWVVGSRSAVMELVCRGGRTASKKPRK